MAAVRGIEPHDDGRFDLMTTGTARFRVRLATGPASLN